MNTKTLVIATGALIIIGAGIGLYALIDSGEKDCEEKYDQVVNEKTDVEDIPEDCQPVPEEVETEILIQAFD